MYDVSSITYFVKASNAAMVSFKNATSSSPPPLVKISFTNHDSAYFSLLGSMESGIDDGRKMATREPL